MRGSTIVLNPVIACSVCRTAMERLLPIRPLPLI